MGAERIAISAMKGGVGKSVTSCNLSAGLAAAGWNVLLVDADAQANSTSMFLNDDDPKFDLYDVITRQAKARNAIVSTRLDNVHLLPSSLAVSQLDIQLVSMHRREARLLEALEDVVSDYDAVLIDMSPSVSPLAVAALSAATSFVVPTDAARWGKGGVELLLSFVEDLREERVVTADLLGVLLTKVEPNTMISREMRTALTKAGHPLFETYIRKRTGMDRMVQNSWFITDKEADPDVAEDYAYLTAEVIQRVRAVQSTRGRHAKEA